MKIYHTKLLFLFILLFRMPYLLGQSDAPTADQIRAQREGHANFKAEDFKPHMVNHPFAGCPLNSSCTQDLGQKRESFSQLLKSSDQQIQKNLSAFIKKSPVPIPIFVRGSNKEAFNDKNFIIWDSACEAHQQIGHNIYIGEALIQNMKELSKFPQALPGLILVERTNGKIQSYDVPRDHIPRYIDGLDLIFLHEEDGRYYNLAYSQEGEIRSVNSANNIPSPEAVNCPPTLLVHYQNLSSDRKDGFSHSLCRALTDKKTKQKVNVFIAWSCK